MAPNCAHELQVNIVLLLVFSKAYVIINIPIPVVHTYSKSLELHRELELIALDISNASDEVFLAIVQWLSSEICTGINYLVSSPKFCNYRRRKRKFASQILSLLSNFQWLLLARKFSWDLALQIFVSRSGTSSCLSLIFLFGNSKPRQLRVCLSDKSHSMSTVITYTEKRILASFPTWRTNRVHKTTVSSSARHFFIGRNK